MDKKKSNKPENVILLEDLVPRMDIKGRIKQIKERRKKMMNHTWLKLGGLSFQDANETGTFDELGGVATTLVSVDSFGNQGDGYSSYSPSASISADGRFVAFASYATNLDLVQADTNGTADIFRHDRNTGETIRVSVHSNGNEGNGYSERPSVSANGSVAFMSYATNLVNNDNNGVSDVFVHGPLVVPCDLNNSGLFDPEDILMFLSQCYDSSAPWSCDLDSDGIFDIPDAIFFTDSCNTP